MRKMGNFYLVKRVSTMKACPYNIHIFLKAVKIDFFLGFAQNIDCGYTLERHHQNGSNVHTQDMF